MAGEKWGADGPWVQYLPRAEEETDHSSSPPSSLQWLSAAVPTPRVSGWDGRPGHTKEWDRTRGTLLLMDPSSVRQPTVWVMSHSLENRSVCGGVNDTKLHHEVTETNLAHVIDMSKPQQRNTILNKFICSLSHAQHISQYNHLANFRV